VFYGFGDLGATRTVIGLFTLLGNLRQAARVKN